MWLREGEADWEGPAAVGTCCGATVVADGADKAMLYDWERSAGAAMVNIELTDSCDCDVIETDSVETEGVGRTEPGKINAEADVEDLLGLTGTTVAERACGKSDGAENAGAGGEVVSKRSKSLLES